MRLVPLFIFLALSLALAFMLLHLGAPAAPGIPDKEKFPEIQVTAVPGFNPWSTASGPAKWDAQRLQGNVTLINFFASWCTPCEAEMPQLAALKKQHPGLRVVGIAWNDEPATLNKWLKKHGKPFDAVWLDQKGAASIALGIKGIPESFVVDGKGILRYRLTGPVIENDKELAELIEKLLSETANAR